MAAIGLATAGAALAGPRVVSLDGCADQYVLGLVPREDILAVSTRATLPDSYYRDRARGLRQVPARSETVLALHPDIVVRTWGGDARLLAMIAKNGVKVININDLTALDQAQAELLNVGHALGRDANAQAEAQSFQAALASVEPIGLDRTALYYTPSGFSAGPDTIEGDILKRLGFRLESQDKGFYYLSPEVILSLKPDVFALAFYDDAYAMRRVPGRNPLVRHVIEASPHIVLPRRMLACTGWFNAYDLRALSKTPNAIQP